MIKVVIFDWGGVVAPNKDGGWVRQLANLLGISFDEALSLWRECSPGLSTNKITEDDFWLLVQQKIGKAPPEHKSNIWRDGLASQPYPEIINLIKQLKERGVKTVVLSNTIEPMERIVDLNNIYKDFDFVVLSHRVGLAKPDSKIFKKTLEQIRARAEVGIFIDDAPNNIDAARKLGFKTILSDHNPQKTVTEVNKLLSN